ncbi:putative GNAT family acetyltransferase [Delitschia confertaspora ATCC 74209]|uniref:GNAT family acetyltransferase n=1 Tax=Delitschia confertaspora ATCC 74209 TaxID=1513339 RepID=A0A9P4MY64_9PLEO|nr:putative GNAT family acetyltransferase [Delitschia confertaspora ATCC 74209]
MVNLIEDPNRDERFPLCLSFAQRSDAARIAAIHMAAFGRNAMLHAQFPSPEVRNDLQTSIEKKALADIEDPNTTVLVVRLLEDNLIAFAKWAHPTHENDDYVEPPWIWPQGTAWDVLEQWSRATEDAQKRVMGDTPCYRLNFIGTNPHYERLGAGSLMVQWGIKQCNKSGHPAYLESTLESTPLYQKNGFEAATTIMLDIKDTEDGGRISTYKEISYVYRPTKQ